MAAGVGAALPVPLTAQTTKPDPTADPVFRELERQVKALTESDTHVAKREALKQAPVVLSTMAAWLEGAGLNDVVREQLATMVERNGRDAVITHIVTAAGYNVKAADVELAVDAILKGNNGSDGIRQMAFQMARSSGVRLSLVQDGPTASQCSGHGFFSALLATNAFILGLMVPAFGIIVAGAGLIWTWHGWYIGC
jgi:hypothetical protein